MADYKNAEGYPDPTAFGAFCAIEKEEKALRAFRPIVYICSPYAGDIESNTTAARRYCRFAVESGYIPIAPHLLFPQFLNDSDPKSVSWACSSGTRSFPSVPRCGCSETGSPKAWKPRSSVRHGRDIASATSPNPVRR